MEDDILPDPWEKTRREMLQSIFTLWWVFGGVVVLAWVVLPWRLGWRGVGVALWMTWWMGFGPSLYFGMMWLKRRLDDE